MPQSSTLLVIIINLTSIGFQVTEVEPGRSELNSVCSLYHYLTGLMLVELLGRWQVPVFKVVAVGLQFGLKHISLLVIEQEQNPAHVFISSEFRHTRIGK